MVHLSDIVIIYPADAFCCMKDCGARSTTPTKLKIPTSKDLAGILPIDFEQRTTVFSQFARFSLSNIRAADMAYGPTRTNQDDLGSFGRVPSQHDCGKRLGSEVEGKNKMYRCAEMKPGLPTYSCAVSAVRRVEDSAKRWANPLLTKLAAKHSFVHELAAHGK